MKPSKIELVEMQTPFRGYFRVDRYHLRHELYQGGMGREISRECFERGHAVAVLPYDAVHDRIVLIEQFRIGAFGAREAEFYPSDMSPWLVECVAGIIEKDESPANVARREAMEEAGLELGELEFLYHYLVSPGGSTESVHLYVGQASTDGVGGVYGVADEGEDINVFAVDLDEALAWMADGRIHNSMTIMALQWLALNRERLKARWGG